MTVVTGGRTVGRPRNAPRVHGRCEGRTSVAPSRWSSSAETFGDPALRSPVAPPGASAPRGSHRCSFGESFVQADEHPCGHPSGPVLDRCQHRSFVRTQACQISYGPTQPSLSVAGSVGECLTDIATDDTHMRAQAQACVGDRCTGRDAYAREQHARLHIRCHPALVQLAYKHSFG